MSTLEKECDRGESFIGIDNPRRKVNDMPVKTQSMPLVSIVTPAYNEEKYLAECIESVLGQTYPNWDYTIVNNCSTDGTLAIAMKYAAQDPRIRVISNDALVPAIANFNIALRQISSTSKYSKIVLADDWIFPECVERMVALMEQHPSVGIVGAYGQTNPWLLWWGLPYPSHLVSGREICRRRLLGGHYVFGSQTSVLYRSDLVRSHDPFYNGSNQQADSEACFELLKESDFGFVHQVLTFSRVRHGSLLESSQELNTAAPDMLHELIVYGPYYLTPEEYANALEVTLAKYYEFLARSLLQRRDGKFWEFHQRRLKEEGFAFSRIRLAQALAKSILNGVRKCVLVPRNERSWGL